jgi:Arc/MetJ-type ribon-helix-helix transcriptional regulator
MTEASSRDIVRKRFSLTEYHDELLDAIVEQRYASRSEALRVAIQHHERYITDGGETDIESIQADLERIQDELETIQEKLDEGNPGVVRVAEQNPELEEPTGNSQTNTTTKEKIVKELLNQGPLSTDELAEGIDQDVMSVITAKQSLEEEGIVCPVSEDAEKYELNG